ncbi:MAG: protein kinase [Thermodesulfobacteriota bacterium]
MRVTLQVTEGPEAGKTFEFHEADTFLVGRTRKAHLRFDLKADRLISRTHFLMDIRPPRCIVMDLHSKNGTYVNDQQVTQAVLKDGDVIRVGKTRILVSISGEEGRRLAPVICAQCGLDVTSEAGNLPPEELKDKPYKCKKCRGETASRESLYSTDKGSPAVHRTQVCLNCEADLSSRANRDGMAWALEGSLYLCEKCEDLLRKSTPSAEGVVDYMLLSEIGRGAMGVVYKAVHKATRRVCAIKMILPDLGLSEHATKMFEREIEVQSKVVHPNLVRVLDRGRSGANPYFVTEYLAGGDVKNLVSWVYQGPLEPELACGITVQILLGLQALHSHGFIHRDLKPSNFLLDRPHTDDNFLVKIADYGLAKSYENAGNSMFDYTREGIAAGSYIFIPPEQITNYKFVKPPVDVYAVGVSLYFMLTGRFSVDFEGVDGGKRHPLEVILEDPPIPLLERRPHLSKTLAAVVDKAVVKEVSHRFQSADEFRSALLEASAREGWRLPGAATDQRTE